MERSHVSYLEINKRMKRGSIMPSKEECYKYCHQIMKKHSKSFSYAFDFLPETQRQAVWVIYAVCRTIDDSIDVYENPALLQEIEDNIVLIEQSSSIKILQFKSNPYIMSALHEVSQQFNIKYESFYHLIRTVRQDQDFKMFATDEELMQYCYGVAGTVGELLTPLLAENPNEKTYHIARTLGQALQLTNILRDVGEDFENNRIYLSQKQLDNFNVSIEHEYNYGNTKQYIELWEHYAQIAEKDYATTLDHIDVFNKESQYIVELAAVIYRAILDEVRKSCYTLHRRVYVSKLIKMKLYQYVRTKY